MLKVEIQVSGLSAQECSYAEELFNLIYQVIVQLTIDRVGAVLAPVVEHEHNNETFHRLWIEAAYPDTV